MVLRFLLHLLVIASLIAASAFPALYGAAFVAETGLLGECFEGGCGYTALFLLFPIFWLLLAGGCIALWLFIYRKHLRATLPF